MTNDHDRMIWGFIKTPSHRESSYSISIPQSKVHNIPSRLAEPAYPYNMHVQRAANVSFSTNTTIAADDNSSSVIWNANQGHIQAFSVASFATASFGAVANVVLLLAMSRYQPLRKTPSFNLITHCVLVDLYTTTVTVPLNVLPVYLGPEYPLPVRYCSWAALFEFSGYVASLHAASVLALHRLVAIVMPWYFTAISQKWVLALSILWPWLVSVVLCIFPLFDLGDRFFRSPDSGDCLVSSQVGVPPIRGQAREVYSAGF